MNNQRINRVLEEIEETRFSPNLDLFPQIMNQINIRNINSERWPNSDSIRKAYFVISVLMITILFAFLLSVPDAGARASQFFQRFGLVLFEPNLEASIPSNSDPTAEKPVPVEQELHRMSLEEAQALVPFPIPTLKLVPEGFILQGVVVGPGPQGTSCDNIGNCTTAGSEVAVNLLYKSESMSEETADASLQLTIYLGTLVEGSGYAVQKTDEQIVFVNGNEATYVRGGWILEDGNAESLDGQNLWEGLEWDNAADTGLLSWEDDNFTYVLDFYNLGLELNDLVAIAESLYE
ncbi:MAG: hypothetical protein HUU38_21310 [Anaerolineales bacterium]|nr:hypothetical protein [Anaerolineales bacterium]